MLSSINFEKKDFKLAKLNLLKYLNKNQDKCLVVIDKKNKLIGTLTDGDIRRSILKGVSFKQSIKKIINKKPFIIKLKKSQKNKEINITKNIFIYKRNRSRI